MARPAIGTRIPIGAVGDAVAADVRADKTFSSAAGVGIQGSAPVKAAQIYIPGTTDQAIGAGQYLSGIQTIKGDPNFIENNIRQGVNMWGKVGTLKEGDYKIGDIVAVDSVEGPVYIKPYLFNTIQYASLDSTGNLYVLRYGNPTYFVEKYSKDGTLLWQVSNIQPTILKNWTSCAVKHDGSYLFITGQSIQYNESSYIIVALSGQDGTVVNSNVGGQTFYRGNTVAVSPEGTALAVGSPSWEDSSSYLINISGATSTKITNIYSNRFAVGMLSGFATENTFFAVGADANYVYRFTRNVSTGTWSQADSRSITKSQYRILVPNGDTSCTLIGSNTVGSGILYHDNWNIGSGFYSGSQTIAGLGDGVYVSFPGLPTNLNNKTVPILCGNQIIYSPSISRNFGSSGSITFYHPGNNTYKENIIISRNHGNGTFTVGVPNKGFIILS